MTIDRETVIRLAQKAGIAYTGQWEVNDADLLRFVAVVLEHWRKPLPVSKDGMAVIIDGVPVPVAVVRRIERAQGITNKESSDAE